MRLRNIPGADDAILNSEYCIKNPEEQKGHWQDCFNNCLLYTSPSPRDPKTSRMPSSA